MDGRSVAFWRASPHTFLLGAGASRAAFPNGDRNGRKLPLMKDFVEIVGLNELLNDYSIDYTNQNIEEIYSDLYNSGNNSEVIESINGIIIEYFSSLKIPDEVTLYDELILSLQKKDVIFSFNWDPLLLQAYSRNVILKELPSIHFLHGNVLVGVCEQHQRVGFLPNRCGKCGEKYTASKLMFPVKNKEYNSDAFIQNEWKALSYYLDDSFMFSIFGYSAPTTDVEAREIMKVAWTKNRRNELNEIDIIDILPRERIEENWQDFIFESHGGIYDDIKDTQTFRYFRRSCESWGDAIFGCDPWAELNLPKFKNLEDLQEWVKPLIEQEVNFRENNILIPKF